MIIVTGAAGFIGSCLVRKLNNQGLMDLVLVDDFSNDLKNKNLEGKQFTEKVHRMDFMNWLEENHNHIDFVFHIGARTDTTEFHQSIFDKLNLNYSKNLWKKCVKYQIPFIYASSAATYGMGEFGFQDSHEIIERLKPLNPYGQSKNDFDKWVLKQNDEPPFWAGFKFFNVFGPNEYHKGRMASVIFHTFNQIKESEEMKLFRSHNPNFKDGEQLRDFIYVKDVCDVLLFMMKHKKDSGIYNLGTGKARSFIDLVKATFNALNKKPNISFIDIPEDIRDKYQYFTQSNMQKLRNIGYKNSFTTLENGVEDYVKSYLSKGEYY
ncbi:MAG: ADP-glyceromanno-heptose 6-epimerase [Flavobacteriales bacterium]|nr:ADP-glyceromanno-heptose 6-epimerase [Flavobacteriales bacterium]